MAAVFWPTGRGAGHDGSPGPPAGRLSPMARARAEQVMVTRLHAPPARPGEPTAPPARPGEPTEPPEATGATGATERPARTADRVVGEEPMEVRLDGHVVATTMRTPGHDFELAAGLLFGDGLLDGAAVERVRYCDDGPGAARRFNVVTVDTGGRAPVPQPRLAPTTASCGLCGTADLAQLRTRLPPIAHPPRPVEAVVLAGLPAAVRTRQALFEATGSAHAAAAFEIGSGSVLLVREDVGRHNAVDKVVGRLLLDRELPAAGLGLFVSGRVSFEIVQKAWAAGFGALAAVSGPSSLAVEAARAAGITLVGFLRGATMNLYSPTS